MEKADKPTYISACPFADETCRAIAESTMRPYSPNISMMLPRIACVFLCAFALSSEAFALPNHAISGSRQVSAIRQRVVNTNLTSKGSSPKMTAAEVAAALQSSQDLPDGVRVSSGEAYRLDLTSGTSGVVSSYIDGFKVCGTEVKSVAVGGANFLVGAVPAAEPRRSFSASDFIGPAATVTAITEHFDGRKVVMDSMAPCLYPLAAGEYRPAQYVWFVVDGRQHYRGYHDGESFMELHPVNFDVDGTAKIYAKNPKDGTIQVFDLLGLTVSGRLTNTYFETRMDPDGGNPNNASRVFVANNQFHFDGDTSSSAFMETSIFTNANRILSYFASIGYTSFGSKAILLNLHPRVKANAQYLPSSTGNPVISIGDGEPGILENLTIDKDVVNHEFGHHVIFGSLKDISTNIDGTRQVLVMHEALADYFAFAFSGDSCLGESICPFGSRVCAVANQCLRTASNTMTMTSGSSRTEEHVRGQFLSGFLWDIRNESGVDKGTFDKTVLKAVQLLRSDSGYQDMLLNLYTADREINGGGNCARIKAGAEKRELARYLSYDCSSGNYEKLSVSGGEQASSSRSSTRSSGIFSFCGTIKGQSATQVSLLYLLGGLLPMLWLGRRKRNEVPSSDA